MNNLKTLIKVFEMNIQNCLNYLKENFEVLENYGLIKINYLKNKKENPIISSLLSKEILRNILTEIP